jgi:hypothetical protein
MRQLKQTFTGTGEVKGFIFTQIKKSEYGYIYKVYAGGTIHYEAFKHVENTRYECVSYPRSKSFGISAWHCSTLEKAVERLEQIDFLCETKAI